MRNMKMATIAGVAGLALLTSVGCVTKKTFRNQVTKTDGHIQEVETAVEANERRVEDLRASTDRRISELDRNTKQALEVGTEAKSSADRAAADADRALKGRLLWSEALSDDKIKFGLNRTGLSADAKTVLDGLVDRIKSFGKAVYVEIEGHTDSSGDAAYNRALSEERAAAVRTYLKEQGVPLHAMNVIGYGEEKPVADNSSSDGRARNRRVVVKVLE